MHKMSGSQARYVFFFFAVAIMVVAAQSGYVSIVDTTVELTCQFDEYEEGSTVTWYKDDVFLETAKTSTLTLADYTDKKSGFYYCRNEKKICYFYIKAKVCKGCVDLDMTVAFVVVIGDVLVTFGIVFIVYFCRRKSGTAAPQRATQARHPRGQARGPPPPDPDYQTLIQATRSTDVYAQAQPRR